MTPNDNFIVINRNEIIRLAASLGQDETKKVVNLIYNENIASGDVSVFMDRIAIAEEKNHIRYSVVRYLTHHPKGEKAKNDDEFVDAVAKATWMLRDDYINALVEDIERAIRCIADGCIKGTEKRFAEMAKSLFPIHTE